MKVSGDATNDFALPAGTEIIAIDGLPVRQILSKLRLLVSADGQARLNRDAKLSIRGWNFAFDPFDTLFYSTFEPNQVVALTVRRPNSSQKESRHVSLVSRSRRNQRLAQSNANFADTPDRLWSVSMPGPAVTLPNRLCRVVAHMTAGPRQ